LKKETKFDDIFVCYHDDVDNCDCRKPKAGLLTQASKKWNIDLKKSFMIGDRWIDIEAGNNVGCKTIFIDYKYDEYKPENPNFITDSLINAASIIKKINV
jgi:D-glycero-D-manno-heptose 1,7-bisphosphate phosphatase